MRVYTRIIPFENYKRYIWRTSLIAAAGCGVHRKDHSESETESAMSHKGDISMKRVIRQWLAGLLSVVLLLTLLPAAALAEEAGGATGQTAVEQVQALIDELPDAEEITDETRADVQAQIDAIDAAILELTGDEAATLDTARYDAAVAALLALDASSTLEQVQALIDALPDAEDINEDNRADVEAQLEAIDEAKLALEDGELDALDITRYLAAVEALLTLDDMAGADIPMPMVFPNDLPGTGTSEDEPYEISTADQLKQLSVYVNGGQDCANTYFRLMADINLDGSAENPWMPIGNDGTRFKGSFDGNNHTVSGLYIDIFADNVGLFGYINSEGTVKNLGVSGYIKASSSNSEVGGIAGTSYGTITGCHSACEIEGGGYTGGIVGWNRATVSDCYNTGSISDAERAGGIVGHNSGNISDCYNAGAVSGTNCAGGIAGDDTGHAFKNCYNVGEVTDAGSCGGIVGAGTSGHSTYEKCYFLASTADNGVGSGGAAGTESKSEDEFRSLAKDLGEGWTNDPFLGRPVLTANKEPWPISGDGSQDEPFEIPNKTTLEQVREYIKNDPDHGKGKFFRLTENIELESQEWTPIGENRDNPFQGTFDGNDKTISGLHIDQSGSNYQGLFGYISDGGTVKNLTVEGEVTGDSNVAGIVGYSDGGTIDNCRNAVTVQGSSSFGGIVGKCQGGTIKNCRNTGTIHGGGSTGGIVGTCQNNCTIENCHNTADITSSGTNVGGVVGVGNDITVINCSNSRAVSGKGIIGGVAGQISSSGAIRNSYNTGVVTGTGESNTGGVVGINGSNCTTENCYNTGAVNGNGFTGGVVGYSSGTVKNCYNTSKISGMFCIGGVAGGGSVENCYNVGSVTGTNHTIGGVVGSGDCTDCYYLEDTAAAGTGAGSDSGATKKTDAAFKSGEVAWLLQGKQGAQEPQVWGQDVGNGTPELTASPDKKVFKITGKVEDQTDVVWYSNRSASLPADPSKAGFTFAGWSTKAGQTEADFGQGDPVSADMIVYAVFTHLQPGTGSVTMVDYTCGDDSVKPVAKSDTNGTANVKFTYTVKGQNDYKEAKPSTAGEYTVKAVFAATDNYYAVTATADFRITHKIPDNLEEGEAFTCECNSDLRLEVGELTEVPSELSDDYSDVDTLIKALAEKVSTGANYAVYDVKLEVKEGAGDWHDAPEGSIPASGITITLSYPEGTDSSYTFTVIHMIWTGDNAGEMDKLEPTNSEDGISFTVQSLSPFCVGWTAPPSSSSGSSSSYPSYYSVTVPSDFEGGSVTSDRTSVRQGNKVTLTVKPDEGYHFDSLTVSDRNGKPVEVADNGDGTYTFTMPYGKVTVDAEFVKCSSLSFTDLDAGAWYHDYTDYVIAHGLMQGTGNNIFAPAGTVNRAQMVMVLWNMSGKPVVNYYMTYSDVSEDAWCAEAIRWATSEGIAAGYGGGLFGPGDPITREQMASMMYRYEQKYGDGGFTGDWMYRLPFADLDQISDWAFEAVAWCNMKGVMSGKADNIFDPKGPAKRSEMAAILTRYCEVATAVEAIEDTKE